MILSYNVTKKEEDSSTDSIKEEDFNAIETIMKQKREANKDPLKSQKNEWEKEASLSDSSQISKIEIKNQSISSSMKESLSRAEDCIQKDVLHFIEQDSIKRHDAQFNKVNQNQSMEGKVFDLSGEMSFQSQKSKNYVLKSSFCHGNESPHQSSLMHNTSNSFNKFNNNCLTYFFGSNNNTQEKENESIERGSNSGLKAHNLIPGLNNNSQSGMHQSSLFNQTSSKFVPQTSKEDNSPSANEYTEQKNDNQKDYMKEIMNKIEMMKMDKNEEASPKSSPKQKESSDSTNNYQQPIYQDFNYNIQFPYNQMSIHQKKIQPNQIEADLIENCATLCKEQAGCRLLQKKIDETPSIASDIIYPKIESIIIELSCDQFGNYFVQKVIEYLNKEQLEDLLKNKIPNNFAPMCFNQHGTRVIQKIFERIINIDDLLSYYNTLLIPNLQSFIIDPNATHIIIKYVSLVQSPKNDFVIEFLSKNVYEIATQKHSCCSLQKCIEYANPVQKHYLLLAIANVSYGLFTDQFGNYVVQFAINACDFEINHIIVLNFLKDFKRFSSQKYSSNVIEKSLDCCDEKTKQLIVEKLCDQTLVYNLLFDMYGNYVLQKTMMLAKEPYRTKFFEMVGPIMENVKVLPFGQKLYNKLLATFPELYIYIKNESNGINPTIAPTSFKKNQMKMKKNPNMMMSNPMMNGMEITQNYQMNAFQNYGNFYYQNNHFFNNPYQFNPQMNVQSNNYIPQQNPTIYTNNNFMNKYYN